MLSINVYCYLPFSSIKDLIRYKYKRDRIINQFELITRRKFIQLRDYVYLVSSYVVNFYDNISDVINRGESKYLSEIYTQSVLYEGNKAYEYKFYKKTKKKRQIIELYYTYHVFEHTFSKHLTAASMYSMLTMPYNVRIFFYFRAKSYYARFRIKHSP